MKKLHKVCTALLSLTLMACTACTPVETNAPAENSLTGANIGTSTPEESAPEETSQPEVVSSSVEEENPFAEALSAIENGTIAKVGDTVRINTWDTVMEYTVQNVQIFNHYTESGIPKSEFDFGLSDLPFILLEVKVKKVGGLQWEDASHKDLITNLCVFNQSMMEEESKGNSVVVPEVCYFDGDPGAVGKEKGYYWLDPGEETVFQVGWCVHEPWTGRDKIDAYLSDTEGLVLKVSGLFGEEKFIDLSTEK